MTNEPKAGRSLDPEMLAAYLDKRLPPEARATVEAQLARDPDSYELLVELIHANEALTDEAPKEGESPEPADREEPQGRTGAVVPMVPKPKRAGGWVIAGGVLAAAAALALVVWLQPELWQRLRGGEPVDPLMAKLVEAVGEERYIEARLTGGFKYGPLRSVTRGPGDLSQQNLALLAAAGELKNRAYEDPSADNLHAWGVAQLVLFEYDAAIDTLRKAVEISPPTAARWADLGAALFARSQAGGDSSDLPAAYEAVGKALEVDPNEPSALFNQPQILHAMGREAEAREAWIKYLAHDDESEWAVHARAAIAKPVSSSQTDPVLAPTLSIASAHLVTDGRERGLSPFLGATR